MQTSEIILSSLEYFTASAVYIRTCANVIKVFCFNKLIAKNMVNNIPVDSAEKTSFCFFL